MAPGDALIAVLSAESVLLLVGTVLIFGHSAFLRVREARLRAGMRASTETVTRFLAGAAKRPKLPRLPLDKSIEVVAEATRSIDDAGRARLAGLSLYETLSADAVRWCTSRRWGRRLKGVRLLAILGDGQGIVPTLLDDKRPEVRGAAAVWAAGHPSASVIERLVGMLDDEALTCRLAAQASLIRMGARIVPALLRHLAERQPAALASSLLIASRVHGTALLGPALKYQDHEDPEVRGAVAQLVASTGGASGVEVLERLLTDPADTVRAQAAGGLGNLGYWPSAPLLAERLGDPAWEVRRAAGLALDRLRAPGHLYLQRALTSSDRFARDMARQVLDRQGLGRAKGHVPALAASGRKDNSSDDG